MPIPGNLPGLDFQHCPKIVMQDVIQMWHEINGKLPGVSVVSPSFADGYANLDPSMIGTTFSLFSDQITLSRPRDDWCNRCYSSFVYLPEKFRGELGRDDQSRLMTDLTCADHHFKQTKERFDMANLGSTEYIRSHSTPLPDHFNLLCAKDDFFAKVARNNSSMKS